MIIEIMKAEDRRTVAAILAENGYRVEIVKIKSKKYIKAEKPLTEVKNGTTLCLC